MPDIEFVWDSRELSALQDGRISGALFRALKKAGGDAIRSVRAEAKRGTRQRVRIRAGYLADRALPLHYPSARDISGLVWRMDVSGREVPLGEYPSRQTRRGVSVEVQRGKRVLMKSAFMARAKSNGGRKSVFLRPTPQRYAMGHKLGMSVADSMADGKVPSAALSRASSIMSSAFGRLLQLELGKLK